MDSLIFSAEGWPLTQQAMQHIEQSNKTLISALTRTFGNNCFIPSNGFATAIGQNELPDGFLIYGNELLPFQGGTVSPNIAIVEEIVEHGYDVVNDGNFSSIQPVWKKRWAKFAPVGTGVADIPYSALKFVESNQQLMSKTRFLKTGGAQIHLNTFNSLSAGTKWTTGDFIGITREFNTFTNYELIYTIAFNSNVSGDYFPLIKLRGGVGSVVTADEVTIIDRSPGSMTIGLIPAHWVGQNDLFSAEMDIYLLG